MPHYRFLCNIAWFITLRMCLLVGGSMLKYNILNVWMYLLKVLNLNLKTYSLPLLNSPVRRFYPRWPHCEPKNLHYSQTGSWWNIFWQMKVKSYQIVFLESKEFDLNFPGPGTQAQSAERNLPDTIVPRRDNFDEWSKVRVSMRPKKNVQNFHKWLTS